MNYEQTQNALLKLLDSMKPDIDSDQLANLGGLIGCIHAEPDKADNRIARAILALGAAVGSINNTRGFKYGLSLSAKAIRTMPPIVELVEV